MISFKGILKYSIYLFAAGWMFLLGIMVGRGNSPVTFDTQKFQERLESIASEFGKTEESQKKIELKFYDVLEQPAQEEGLVPRKKSQEIIPKKEQAVAGGRNSVKTSLKKQTYKKQPPLREETITQKTNKTVKAPAKKQLILPKPAPAAATKPAEKKAELKKSKTPLPGRYTIQIAAYKEFKDAVTQMSILEKKGFSSYRVKGQKDGVTWYRVRIGSFATYDQAKIFKQKLNKAKIKSMILKKENNENIKG